MKVNMTPNPLDVVTIHASQGDTEARQWEFELHNNGELIDTSDVTEQMFFKAYKGGTEQILPENGSTPTTSPFKGDIKYPQGLLSDQEFTYRQSPTEEDGLAKVNSIKGNTLVWNQLNQNGNYQSTSGLTTWGCTISASNNILTFKATNYSGNYAHPFLNLVSGHKYLVGVTIQKEKAEEMIRYGFEYGFVRSFIADNITTKKRYYQIVESTYTGSAKLYIASTTPSSYTDFGNVYVSDYVCFDLTQMGLDISNPSDFASLFSLPYYAYNQGTLLSFNGNGIKTVGKNLVSSYQSNLGVNQYGIVLSCEADMKPNTTYSISFVGQSGLSVYPNENMFTSQSWISMNGQRQTVTLTTKSDISNQHTADGWSIFKKASGSSIPFATAFVDVQIEFGSTATSYEPYTSSTLSLPISTYFPTGMKSAGNVYDELTESKAITRIGAVDLGSFTWSYNEQYQCFTTYPVLTDSADVNTTSVPNFTSIYKAVSWSVGATDATQDMATCFLSSAHQLRVRNKSFTDPTAFKTAMNGVYLYYELATTTETSFTTASLVTENAEIPLSNEDGVLIGKCTEQLSSESGFFDAKIKLADEDGECYSNKIQLHIERSPQ